MLSVKAIFTVGIFAAAAVASPHERQKRADASVAGANCTGRIYNSLEIFSTEHDALQLLHEGKTVGQVFGPQYPRPWANPDNLTIALPGPYIEFPLLRKIIYDGNEDPGLERLIFTADQEVATVVTVTHPEGVEEGSYKLCSTS